MIKEDIQMQTSETQWLTSADQIIEIENLLEDNDVVSLKAMLENTHFSAAADIIEQVSPEYRLPLINIFHQLDIYDFWAELDDNIRTNLLQDSNGQVISKALDKLDIDDVVEILEDIEDTELKENIVKPLATLQKISIKQGLDWPEDSAGRLMQPDFITLPAAWQVGHCIDWFRQQNKSQKFNLSGRYHEIYILDEMQHPVGIINLIDLVMQERHVLLKDFANKDLSLVSADTDKEDVAYLFKQKDLISAAVINDENHIIGIITIDDIVDVIEEEHTEDLMALSGLTSDDLNFSAVKTSFARLKWLFVNLFTSVIAAFVISFFSKTIEAVVILAALMPIVASVGGNAGSQTLTVAIRALATKSINEANATRFLKKELVVAIINSLVIASCCSAALYFVVGDVILSLTLLLAIITNLIVAGLAGAFIPLILEKIKIDPAIASSTLVTSITDIIGFFVFLSLASILLIK